MAIPDEGPGAGLISPLSSADDEHVESAPVVPGFTIWLVSQYGVTARSKAIPGTKQRPAKPGEIGLRSTPAAHPPVITTPMKLTTAGSCEPPHHILRVRRRLRRV